MLPVSMAFIPSYSNGIALQKQGFDTQRSFGIFSMFHLLGWIKKKAVMLLRAALFPALSKQFGVMADQTNSV